MIHCDNSFWATLKQETEVLKEFQFYLPENIGKENVNFNTIEQVKYKREQSLRSVGESMMLTRCLLLCLSIAILVGAQEWCQWNNTRLWGSGSCLVQNAASLEVCATLCKAGACSAFSFWYRKQVSLTPFLYHGEKATSI